MLEFLLGFERIQGQATTRSWTRHLLRLLFDTLNIFFLAYRNIEMHGAHACTMYVKQYNKCMCMMYVSIQQVNNPIYGQVF